ncbi:MAG: hypothetical protein NVS1B13_08980 [Flavisolibacter sp.]
MRAPLIGCDETFVIVPKRVALEEGGGGVFETLLLFLQPCIKIIAKATRNNNLTLFMGFRI